MALSSRHLTKISPQFQSRNGYNTYGGFLTKPLRRILSSIEMDFLIFLTVKLVAYSVFMYVGLSLFRGDKPGYIALAILFGFLRVVAGLILGVIAIIGATQVLSTDLMSLWFPIVISSTVLWTIFGRLMGKSFSMRTLTWTACGVLLSGAFDIFGLSRAGEWGGWRGC